MSNQSPADDKVRFDRSPSYPFISLRKAEERAKQFWAAHRKEGARLSVVAVTWGYGIKSSGLQQTVGALKQYGLMEDVGSGEDRRVQLTELGRRLVADQREGATDAARKESALRPRLFQEYRRWIAEMPSAAHCLSELELDRGFNAPAAQTFLKSFVDTISFARLRDDDRFSSSLVDDGDGRAETSIQEEASQTRGLGVMAAIDAFVTQPEILGPKPFADRCKVEMTPHSLRVTAVLLSLSEVDVLIRILQANKTMLEEDLIG